MRRLLAHLAMSAAALAAPALVLPGGAAAATSAATAQVTGTLTATGSYSFAIQTSGRSVGVLNALVRGANKLAAGDYPYVWGGGHAQAGVASVGIPQSTKTTTTKTTTTKTTTTKSGGGSGSAGTTTTGSTTGTTTTGTTTGTTTTGTTGTTTTGASIGTGGGATAIGARAARAKTASAKVASAKAVGYDCSGAVAAVLESAGLWPAGQSVPNDAGVIQYLLSKKLIARGAGTGPQEVTLYDDPGVHIFLNIDGRFFGTSDGGGKGGDAAGGPGWLDDSAPDATNPVFRRYHFVPSALSSRTNAPFTLGFQLTTASAVLGATPGMKVQVAYSSTNQGTMVAHSVKVVGEQSGTGTIQALASNGTSVTILDAAGNTLKLATPAGGALANLIASSIAAVGDQVSIQYVRSASGALTLLSLLVTAEPALTLTTTTTTPTTTTSTSTSTTTVTTTMPAPTPVPLPPSTGSPGL